MALLTLDPLRAGVSIDLNVTFVAAAKVGEKVRIVGTVLKSGKRLGFTEVTLYKAKEGASGGEGGEDGMQVVATGRHTKAL